MALSNKAIIKFYHFLHTSLVITLVAFVLAGCVGTRYLKGDQLLLYEQKIKGTDNLDKEKLEDLFRQKTNRRFPIIPFAPYVGFYQYGLKYYDKEAIQEEKQKVIQRLDRKIEQNTDHKKKTDKLIAKKERKITKLNRKLEEGNIWMRWGEPLAVYDSALTEETREVLNKYLQTKGYFNGKVTYDVNILNKLVSVIYTVQERKPYTIDTISYVSADTAITRIIYDNLENQAISQGDNYDQDELTAERTRIDELLKNSGYFDFSRQYISIFADTTLGDLRVATKFIIQEPEKRGYHKIFEIDSVIFNIDDNITEKTADRQTEVYDHITYRFYHNKYYKKILDSKIFIHPGDLYNKKNTLETQRQLSNLDVFKFININYDTTGGKMIANIYTSPLKKFQTSNEVGLNVSQAFPGPFFNTSLKVRNVFGGLEIMEVSGRAGIEGVPPVTEQRNVFKSSEAGGTFSLTFPQFIFPFINRFTRGEINPKTRVQTGYSFVDRPEYRRSNFKTSISYSWQKQQKILYELTLADINYIDSRIQSDAFQQRLDELEAAGNKSLPRAFLPSFVTSTIFNTTFNFNNYGSNTKASFLRLYLENGGLIFNYFNAFTNLLDSLNLQYFRFFKINTDYRQYAPVSRSTTLAYRFNVGIAAPYGGTIGLPYEKLFFAGGSNSIRAWPARRLGPGSSAPDSVDIDGYYVYLIEQPGEILLESSIEIRQKLFGFVDGAIFLDAGNSWLIKEDDTRPGGNFDLNRFYKEIALGTGLGLRFDFSYLIARFDFGLKVYDPARDLKQRWIGQQFTLAEELQHFTFNFGIGYPF